ncbi:hypothetical protein [Rhodovulum sp. YEN HP10]|uniref:hypothetical protein n=1 Tax=Rhodovulum sp. HP10 TaxID=3387397 RepID=UPI0039E08878
MPISDLSLRKALKLSFADQVLLRRELRTFIRTERNRENGADQGGGDFYGPFWRDAKQHALGLSDLSTDTEARIDANPRRANLYPELRDGFLLWWGQRRRWTNAPYEQGARHFGSVELHEAGISISVENLLSVIDGRGDEYLVYPYFFPAPVVSEEAASIALWVCSQALPRVPAQQIRVLDVMRGTTFSLDRNPLSGDERATFCAMLNRVVSEYEALIEE